MNTYKTNVDIFDQELVLPDKAFRSLNKCNIPASVLGSIEFQQHPKTIFIDGVKELFHIFFDNLDQCGSIEQRAQLFMDHMAVYFRLHCLVDAGWEKEKQQHRGNADYLHMLRGWLFDTNSQEGAILKSWVESRLGIVTRYHCGRLTDAAHYQTYLQARSRGLHSTNALEAQLDLLYSYCQYELSHRYDEDHTLLLYRGTNNLDEYDILKQTDARHATVLLNNLNSFSCDKDRACEFGDMILQCQVPWQKIFFYSNLLPGMLAGENEYLVVGGAYDISISHE